MLELIKAALKTSFGSISTLIFGVITTKVLAITLGVEGIGLYSLLRSIRDTVMPLALLGGGTATIQGVASKSGDERKRYISSVTLLMIISLIFITFGLIIFAPLISQLVFKQQETQTVTLIRWLVLPLTLGVISSLFSYVLNGFRAIGRLAFIAAAGSLILALVAYPLARLFQSGHNLAMIGIMSIVPFSIGFLSMYFIQKEGWLGFFIPRFLSLIHI